MSAAIGVVVGLSAVGVLLTVLRLVSVRRNARRPVLV
jgi:hypothetical protein